MHARRLAVLLVAAALAAGCSGHTAPHPNASADTSAALLVSDPDDPQGGTKTAGRLGSGTLDLTVSAAQIAELSVRYDCLGPSGLTISSGNGLNTEVAGCDDAATYGASIKASALHGRKFAHTVTVKAGPHTRWRVSVEITTRDGGKQKVGS